MEYSWMSCSSFSDFNYENERILLLKDRSEITNPLLQLSRTESLLRQLLIKLNYTIPIESSVVFINPEFIKQFKLLFSKEK